MKFQAPAILTRISHLKDGGLSLGFSTNELSDQDKLIASQFFQKFGWVLFSESALMEKDIPKNPPTDENKSPAQRLRAVLFVLWEQKAEPKPDFETFYRLNVEKAIDRVKRLLD